MATPHPSCFAIHLPLKGKAHIGFRLLCCQKEKEAAFQKEIKPERHLQWLHLIHRQAVPLPLKGKAHIGFRLLCCQEEKEAAAKEEIKPDAIFDGYTSSVLLRNPPSPGGEGKPPLPLQMIEFFFAKIPKGA